MASTNGFSWSVTILRLPSFILSTYEQCFEQVIVAPDELDPPQDHEFYGMSSMVYRGFRIGFLSVFHVLYEGIVAREGLPGQKI